MNKIIDSINRINPFILLFILFALSTFGFTLTGNEEHYLAYLRKSYDPNWFPQSSFFEDFPGTRLPFQTLCGWWFIFLDFEAVALFGRMLQITLLSFPLIKLAKHFNLNNIALLVIFPLWLPEQSLFAGGWMIGAFETKVFSYIFSLWAIYLYFTKKYWWSIFFQVLAFYFHILVGGWISIILGILFLFDLQVKTIKYYLVYVLAIFPFLLYLINGMLLDPFQPPDVNLDWVYVYYRHPHHMGLFKSSAFFFRKHFYGILISFFLYIVHLIVYRKVKNKKIKQLALFNIVLFSQQFIMLIVAYFDKNGTILKSYPFRTSVVFALFSWFELFAVFFIYREKLKQFFLTQHKQIRLALATLAASLFLLNIASFALKKTSEIRLVYPLDLLSLVAFAKTTPEDSKFIQLTGGKCLAFPRMSQRASFVMHKFIPTNKQQMYAWYKSMLELEKVRADINYLKEIYQKKNIQYVLTKTYFDTDFMSLVYENNAYKVYKLNP